MLLQNPLKYLLDNFYTIKYKKENKKYTNKNINFYIAATYKKTQRNKKFKKLQYIFNPFTALYLQRNIYSNPRYDLHEYYKNDPMSQHEFYSLKNYNFYDTLFFEYAQHKDGERIFKELYEYESKKLNLSFY